MGDRGRRSLEVLIVGAGIGGLTAALELARIGARVTVVERAPELATVGAGVQISPNASRILRRLDVLGPLEGRATRPVGIRVRSGSSGRTLSLLPLRDAETRWGAPYLVARRADLQAVLAEAVAAEPSIDLRLGTAVAGFGASARGVQVSVKQGVLTRTLDADALIGADGVRSTVRARLAAAAEDDMRPAKYLAWRALVERGSRDGTILDGETGLWLGPGAHLVHYPIADGRLVNVVAVTADGAGSGDGATWSEPGDPALLAKRFAGWDASARNLIAAATSWTTWPLPERKPLETWNAGPIALLGDAAHPILPFLAQGAAQAIEDAAALAAALGGERDIAGALASYSRARLARATRVQAASQRLGRVYHLSGPAALARNVAIRAMGSTRLLAQYDWLYGLSPRLT